jgi:hypothetical protein
VLPGGTSPTRDPRLALFSGDGLQEPTVPSGRQALLADELSGPERRCPGATDNELVGLLRAWAALESWAAGAKLGVIRELIRRDSVTGTDALGNNAPGNNGCCNNDPGNGASGNNDPVNASGNGAAGNDIPGHAAGKAASGAPGGGGCHGDLPDAWSPSLRYELAAALACSTQSAETTAWLAWEQQARLPGTGALLDDGTLTPAKARAVTETFRYLTDVDATRAEALIVSRLAGKTYTQVLRLAEEAALTVDPELAERRREQAQKKDARVTFLREQAGTAALSGRDLPPDEALAAMASVNARAQHYKDAGAFGDTRMDVLRAQAYLDLLNGITVDTRIACAEP